MDTLPEQASYGIGYGMGEQLKAQNVPGMSLESLIMGLTDALEGRPQRIDEAELEAAFDYLRQRQSERQVVAPKTSPEGGETFLADNRERDGVTTTRSGLQYEVIRSGDGPSPSAGDRVKTHYRGELIDGTVFDSSYERGQPMTFRVNQVIGGWTEALQLMKVGAKWRLFIPSELGYGPRGAAAGRIPPNAVLVFEVELLQINPSP
ncbi:MAG: FKBP-type peptidyl-prolyl cis-trans isomerase [Pseudomonadales bacterium]